MPALGAVAGPLITLMAAAGITQVLQATNILRLTNPAAGSERLIRLNRLLMEDAYRQEIARSLGGVYPDREIYQPTAEDSQRCFR